MANLSERYMQRCLELAQLGASSVAPNPMVGCVIVHNGVIIGEGFTSPYGGNHAEVNAIHSVEDTSVLKDATLYVSLEPCAHYGKTPPCANLIIEKNIKRVVIACLDPFAKVNGLGVKRLIEAGIDVKIGVLETEAQELNRRFFTFHQKKRPYIILKWAETADGFVDGARKDTGQPPLKITGNTSNLLVHKWRAEEAAIMVGKNTALRDDPSLTTRHYKGKNPIRILLDARSDTPSDSNIFNDEADTLVFSEEADSATSHLKSNSPHHTTITVKDIRNLQPVLTELYSRNIQSVLVEGGPTLQTSFYEAGLWDEIRRFVSPIRIEEGVKALQIDLMPEKKMEVGTDSLLIYTNQ